MGDLLFFESSFDFFATMFTNAEPKFLSILSFFSVRCYFSIRGVFLLLPALLTALLTALGQVQQPDVLQAQRQLLEASQQSFRLTTEQLSALLGLSKQTVQSKKSGFIRLGFQYEKVKEGSSTLWKVLQVK